MEDQGGRKGQEMTPDPFTQPHLLQLPAFILSDGRRKKHMFNGAKSPALEFHPNCTLIDRKKELDTKSDGQFSTFGSPRWLTESALTLMRLI